MNDDPHAGLPRETPFRPDSIPDDDLILESLLTASSPGSAFRFAVATDTKVSMTFSLWTNKNKSDVYVAMRSFAGVKKVSMHESGSWQYGFISDEKAREYGQQEGSRHHQIWRRPAKRSDGLTLGMSIIVPEPEIMPMGPDDRADAKVTYFRPPGELPNPYAVVFDLWFMPAGTDLYMKGVCEFLHTQDLPSGETLLVTAKIISMLETEDLMDHLVMLKEMLADNAIASGWFSESNDDDFLISLDFTQNTDRISSFTQVRLSRRYAAFKHKYPFLSQQDRLEAYNRQTRRIQRKLESGDLDLTDESGEGS